MQEKYIVVYLVIINMFTFITYGNDKQRAKKNRWRIPEKTLIFLALAGGGAGAWLGMRIFRHKTQKPLFKIGIPCIVILQIILLAAMQNT